MGWRQPIIGVTTTVIPRKDGFFGQMARRASELGARLVLFHPNEIKFDQGIGYGYEWTGLAAKVWRKSEVPLPDVIYENVFVHLVMQGMVRSLRHAARVRGIPVFNPLIAGKAAMTPWIADCTSCGVQVPVTRRILRVQTLDEMLRRFGVIYVKPSGGYGGRGVYRLRAQQDKIFIQCDRFYERGPLRLTVTRPEFARFAQRHFLRIPHIAQERIPLIKYHGGQIDFRVVIQRNRNGVWELVGIVPKIAAPDGVVTNLVAGGSRMRLAQLQTLLRAEGMEIDAHALERVAMNIGRLLMKRYPKLGILGYDLGIDERGQVWFIELNPKPARRLLFPEMQRRAGELAVDFALYLAEPKAL
ncbi:YheC/YheD family protein [Sulfoacidibacillus thermotolerans]|uniref:ATP-grasp domain-containing protein n=1 Tax=Sulfoacidibacillus thermotolerans TaxID=1765684 RepID=A0A2U3D907_SULT2|nr:YheC/YheD family protein [Sulfoacidibacillus thermotolerans]PWI57757.1 hypothetical protein BM613_07190 [Sulfoacidibacillus thermotolerans]